ncbi:MAG: Flap endonuclease 1 [Candidatus Bathyarchaeota archaeon BA1]|nr:MAG: Flap endonuclease 1 [Candidatus Bathyarchaeota archaeon BA1]
MGVNLTPIIVKRVIRLEDLRGKSLAVDANNYLYQFLALIRTRDGTPLRDPHGNITSHLAGLMFRSTCLLHDYEIDLVFVFDGEPPKLKEQEILKRRELREKATREWGEALKEGNYATAFSKAVMTSRLTKPMIEDSKHLLKLLGIPYVQAPSEAEAQTAYMAMRGDVWAASSRDYDSLLFGAPQLVRNLTISGREFLPSKGTARPLKPELINLGLLLSHYEITRKQLIDVAILMGTDFNEGVRGVGPKTALRLIKRHGKIENLPNGVCLKAPPYLEEIRRIFLEPKVSPDYTLQYGDLREDELYTFLRDQRGFSEDRVKKAVQRMERFYLNKRQRGLEEWFTEASSPSQGK